MGNAQSTPRPPKITAQDKAILQLKLQRDKLHKATIKISLVINREKEIAKECIKKDQKSKALLALKKKKYQENLLDTISKQADTLEQLIGSIEFKLIEKDVLYGLEEGNKVLKQLNSEMSIDKVEKILDDSEAGIRYQEEISTMLGESMSQGLEDEVDEELAQMEREELIRSGKLKVDEEPSKIPASKINELPEVPTDKLESPTKEDEEEEEEEQERQRNKPVLLPA
ncbi:hypothetical protein B5S31_g3296 [[Candida] boidinii]|nr:hypothetical protein B5S29_g4934 [[Candida] boidinii]OWB73549.1 hypothetical protein B5S31_g3296 [[Candida] boidinii]